MDLLVFCDTETSGLPHKGGWLSHEIVTWSGIISDLEFNIYDKITVKSRPACRHTWTQEAEDVHGISWEQSRSHDKPETACEKIKEFLSRHEGRKYWIEHSLGWIDILFTEGHFMKHDNVFDLRKEVNRTRQISSIKVARKMGYSKNSLNVWAERIGFDLKHHDSESDTMALYETVKFLSEGSMENKLENFINFSKSNNSVKSKKENLFGQ